MGSFATKLNPNRQSTLRAQVEAFLRAWEQAHGSPIWTATDRLIVGVSGGPDSLALLHLLAQGKLHPRQNLVVAHLNHKLRDASDDDAQFVAQTCANWGVPYRIEEVDVAELARRAGHTLEEAGRIARYRFLGELARQADAKRVLVAHTANDQVETVLMHFVRGTGLAGLRGMAAVTPLQGMTDVLLVRPLLKNTRDDVEAYCRVHQLTPILDVSNKDITFFRNRLRHELLPLLAEYNPQIQERLVQLASVASADYELLDELGEQALQAITHERRDDWLRVDLAGWRALPLALRRLTLRRAVWVLRSSLADVSFRPIELARQVAEQGDVGTQAVLPGGLVLTVEYNAWRLSGAEVELPTRLPQLLVDEPQPLVVPGRVPLANGWWLEASYVAQEHVPEFMRSADVDPWVAYLDASIAQNLHVRGRREGERFRPFGMEGHSVKISDFMINEKIPAQLRDRWPIVACESHAVWLIGLRIDERAKVPWQAEQALVLNCARDDAMGASLGAS